MRFVFVMILFYFAMPAECHTPGHGDGIVVPVIPKPVEMELTGKEFTISSQTSVYYDLSNDTLSRIAEIFRKDISRYDRIELSQDHEIKSKNIIALEISGPGSFPPDGYRLSVTSGKIWISSSGAEGIFYGLQSLKQMILASPFSEHGETRIPCLEITDYPRFAWRGMHLDVSRHFFPVDSIKRYVDFLALYKLNRFHWHLTDDQGWRIEIRKYPKLTSTGAWRKPRGSLENNSPGDVTMDSLYGGYYTQDEIREVVRYASERFVTVVPEIEMPGHTQAVIASYPELGVTGTSPGVKIRWGISPFIYAPSEKTFHFLEDVLDEVMELFPSEYIHIGGDEAIKDQWREDESIQIQIRKLGLKDEDELQSWFIGRIGEYLSEHGRKMIGWDEILEGGIPAGATVMSWRGEEGGIRAARSGHDAVMCPNTYLYLNFAQTEDEPVSWVRKHVTHLSRVYSYEPVSAGLSAEESRHIIGAEGCVWTEHIPDFNRLEHMIFPRITALSEVAWSDKSQREFDTFLDRVEAQVPIFQKMDINYCKEEL